MLATRFSARARAVRASHALSEDEMLRVAPSVFATSAHESRSARYAYIPTIDVLRGLGENGFRPFFAVQAIARSEERRGHTKHMLRLRHESQIAAHGDVNEVILINSHDGGSSYQMLAGCYRFVCANGMVCGTTTGEVRVKHSGDVRDQVIEGAFQVLDSFGEVDAAKDAFKSLELSNGEQLAFARAALAMRFDEAEKDPPIVAEQVNEARRWEDRGDSLWNTFQRAQENLVRGGVRTQDGRRRIHTRGVNGIDGNVALNRGLWRLAEEMRKLRTGSVAA